MGTLGQEKYRPLGKIFFKDSHCIILGYDIINKYSFNAIKTYFYDNVKNILGENSLIYLVDNKIDLKVSCKAVEGINE